MGRSFRLLLLVCGFTLSGAVGCSAMKSSDTARTGTEQLLITNAVDEALNKVDFRPFREHKVFLNEKYVDCIDKNYVISSVRHRILSQGAVLVDSADQADIVVELRTGVVGTDKTDAFFGVPEINLPAPLPVAFPEIRLISRTAQFGTAKIGMVAYDARTREVLGDGGMSSARADNNNWFVMGLGPWQSGSVKQEIKTARELRPTPGAVPSAFVAFSAPEPESFSTPEYSPTYPVSSNPGPDAGLE